MTAPLIEGFTLRSAERADIGELYCLVTELADYEKITHELLVTPAILEESLFDRKAAFAFLVESGSGAVGFVICYYSFSSFIGKPGLYLEDIYIRPRFRGNGLGKAILRFLAQLAIEKGCWGMEWTCLDWNKPSINFYELLGAKHREGWMVFRLRDEALLKLADTKSQEDN